MSYLSLFLRAAVGENMALAFFLGMCTFLGGSRRVGAALSLGAAVVVVMTLTVPLNHLIHRHLLAMGAWAWIGLPELDLTHLTLICFIGSVAAVVHILEMFLERFYPALSRSLGIFLPLVTVNCAVLAGSLFMADRGYSLSESVVYGAGGGLGWAAAVVVLAAIREHLEASGGPSPRSEGLLYVVVGIMSLAFAGFTGMGAP